MPEHLDVWSWNDRRNDAERLGVFADSAALSSSCETLWNRK
jgi:hypothetical protein